MRPPPPAPRVLVIAPHPDDEAIGAWATMRRYLRDGARVSVLIVSDGSASHPGSVRWPVERLVTAREREVRRAMRGLGLIPSAIGFLRLPDGGLEHAAKLTAALTAVVRRRRARLIVGPVADDAHADHRAVAAALAHVPRRGERRLGYHVWPEGAGRRHTHAVALDARAIAMKRRVVCGYRTQTGVITDADAGFTITHRHLRAFVAPRERFTVIR